MSKELFGETSKCRKKKQEARRKKKIEQEKLERKSLDIRNGGLEDVLPSHVGEGGEKITFFSPLPAPRKYQKIVFLLSQTQLKSKQFYIEFREKKTRSSQLVQCNIEFRIKSKIL